jgi:hypothetical protein
MQYQRMALEGDSHIAMLGPVNDRFDETIRQLRVKYNHSWKVQIRPSDIWKKLGLDSHLAGCSARCRSSLHHLRYAQKEF